MLAVGSRLSTALIADRVAVLGEGRIRRACRTHLTKNSAPYRALRGF